MIQSMTGYGKAVYETPARKTTIEVRALNSKQMDVNMKIPRVFKEKELEIRNLVNQRLGRGKIDVSVYVEVLEEENPPVINQSVVKSYYHQLQETANMLGIPGKEEMLGIIMRLPEVLRTEKPEVDDQEWSHLKEHLANALQEVVVFRTEEGKSLEKDLMENLKSILRNLEEVVPLLEDRIYRIRKRIEENLLEVVSQEELDPNRLEQELIYYIEKLDVNEEIVRLKNHCVYFQETLNSPGLQGKKLGFISQEMGREINTLGAKANDATIQKKVILMKEQLEKIKEQVLNVL